MALFSVLHKMNMSIINLNNDLSKIRNLASQWKINFNHDSYKQAQKAIFFLSIIASFKKFPLKKNYGMYLGTKLNLQKHLN